MSHIIRHNTADISRESIDVALDRRLNNAKKRVLIKRLVSGSATVVCLGAWFFFSYSFFDTLLRLPLDHFLHFFEINPAFSITNTLIVIVESMMAGVLVGLAVKGFQYRSDFGKNLLSDILTFKIFNTDPGFFSSVVLSLLVSSLVGGILALIGSTGTATILSINPQDIAGVFSHCEIPLMQFIAGGGSAGGADGIFMALIILTLIIFFGYLTVGLLCGMVSGLLFGLIFGIINGAAKGAGFSSMFSLVSVSYFDNKIGVVIIQSIRTGMIQGAIVGGCTGGLHGLIASLILRTAESTNTQSPLPELTLDRLGVIGIFIQQLLEYNPSILFILIAVVSILMLVCIFLYRLTKGKKRHVSFPSLRESVDEFMEAASNGHLGILKRMIADGFNLHEKKFIGINALNSAAGGGHLSTVKLLIGKGVGIDQKDSDGMTALMFAALSGQIEVLRFLIRKGADVNAESKHSTRVIGYAALQDNPEIILTLIDSGARDKSGEALKTARERGNMFSMRILEKADDIINARRFG